MTDSPRRVRPEEQRRVLIEQLLLLIDELEALRSQIRLIPDAVITERPLESEPSFNEIYGLLARFDEEVYSPAVKQLLQSKTAEITLPEASVYLGDEPAQDQNIMETIDWAQRARRNLVALLERIPLDDWSQRIVLEGQDTDLFGLAYAIAQHDATLQQAAAYRLHESRLTSGDEDLPK